MTSIARLLARHRDHLSIVAAVLSAISLAILLRQNQAYVPTYQTFPLADWIEFTFGPNDAASFGPAEVMVWQALPLLDSFSLGVAEYKLLVAFSEPNLRREVSGLESSYAVALSTARDRRDGVPRPPLRLSGELELRVFRNSSRAKTYAGLRAYQLNTTKGMVQVTPQVASSAEYEVWLNLEQPEPDDGAQTFVVGHLGPAAYEVALHSLWEGQRGEGRTVALIDRTQRTTETLALEWVRLMRAAWEANQARR